MVHPSEEFLQRSNFFQGRRLLQLPAEALTPWRSRVRHGHNRSQYFTEEGKVYAWGWGDKGRLGLYSTESCYTPSEMKFPILNQNSSETHINIIKPRAIALGGAHTLLLTGFLQFCRSFFYVKMF